MNSKDFKGAFNQIARKYSFEKAYSGWFKESKECIAVLDLQKSNYGDYYELNIKIFIQGAFGSVYRKGKDLVKKTPATFSKDNLVNFGMFSILIRLWMTIGVQKNWSYCLEGILFR